MTFDASSLVGFRVIGRHGLLGVVVEDRQTRGDVGDQTLVVRGGLSDALLFRLPTSEVRGISVVDRTVIVEADVGDFAARLAHDGTVELDLGR